MPDQTKNKLSIYLLKEGYENLGEVFKSVDELKVEEISDFGIIFYGESHISKPSWVDNFYSNFFDNEDSEADNTARLKLFNASSKAVFLARAGGRKFAVTFGYGHTLLRPGSWDERFGLKVALSVVKKLKAIDKQTISANPKQSVEQISRDSEWQDFGIDIEQDLIQGVRGKTKIGCEDFGKMVTGKDALSLSVSINVSNIKVFLRRCLEKYQSDDYKEDFEWIDQIAEIRDPDKIGRLNDQLLDKIQRRDFDNVWMSIPEIVPWENVQEFRISGKDDSLGDDVHLEAFLGALSPRKLQNLSLGTFKREVIECIAADTEVTIANWRAYNCLYCEAEEDGIIYILSNGKWYEIEKSFSEKVSKEFELIKENSSQINLPPYQEGEHENVYNERVPTELEGFYCLDRKIIQHGGAYGKVEFCDLISNNGQILHVKRYGSSSVFSHLFSQGLVSSELLLSDYEFLGKLNTELPAPLKLNLSKKVNPADYEIFFVVLSDDPSGDLKMPFFSKVNLRNAKKRLNAFGYKVSLMKVPLSQS
ncbi:MAG: TIGR04141 family sporadically distributed protein [Candidatus Peribacteraceae bacterium]|nr:TIGR04141 family sporadically distributed protein [Candidatus Peribacteraceae bacterium]